MSESSHTSLAGTVLCGRYEVRGEIGRGGMATVYEAFDRIRGEVVALKLISDELRADPDIEHRFFEEAKLTSELNHPGVINVHDIEHSERGLLISMERLRGGTLRDYMLERRSQGRQVELDIVIRFVRQIGAALEYAHLYTVHRDLKPENIWLGEDGATKIMDFGLAKRHAALASAKTQAGTSLGTPYYIAPEQLADAGQGGPLSDQYSLAALVYELLAGEVPAGMPKQLHTLRPDIPRRVSRVIERGLARDPQRRFESINAFTLAFCDPSILRSLHLDSGPRLALAAIVCFCLGLISVAVMEQVETALAARGAGREYWGRTASANQRMLVQEYLEANQIEAELSEKIRWLTSGNRPVPIPESTLQELEQVSRQLQEGRLAGSMVMLERLRERLNEASKSRARDAREEAEARSAAWLSSISPWGHALRPDLNHVARPGVWLDQANEAFRDGDFQAAEELYRKSSVQHGEWIEEITSLHQRTWQGLATLSRNSPLHTNVLGMVFVKLPVVELSGEEYWISVWETRVVDYARFAADGLNWESKYQAGEFWREVSPVNPCSPVTGVSKIEAINFCRWLDHFRKGSEEDRGSRGPMLVNGRVREHLRKLVASGEFEGATVHYPEAIYAFGETWPPMRNVSPFVGDETLVASRYIKPVAGDLPNALGLFDFDSNVWEFQLDTVSIDWAHWYDSSLSNKSLAGGSHFGTVSISDQSDPGWPGVDHPTKIGRAEGIGFRIMLSDIYLKEREHLEAPARRQNAADR